jgi:bifunctional NMN adenylyltransferase/nudix hydrolase
MVIFKFTDEGDIMKKSLAVYIGRFRPLHNAHRNTIETCLKENDEVLILIGSCGNPRNIKNPFTFDEINIMIRSCFSEEENSRIKIEPLLDHSYDDTKWISQVQGIVNTVKTSDENIKLYGNEKDHSSFYLKFFPQWKFRDIENVSDLHATDIRRCMFSDEDKEGNWMLIQSKVPKSVFLFLKAFEKTQDFKNLKEEYDFIQKYRKSWEKAPYPPTFVTVDAVVECLGHVLMIQRKATPGRGLWAMPGGFIDVHEKIEDAMIRELKEETKIDVSHNLIKGSIKAKEVFDNPYRSLRGRTITHAYHVVLNLDYLPKVKADDDAMDAVWIPLATLAEMSNLCFEDHIDIVAYFTKISKVFKH